MKKQIYAAIACLLFLLVPLSVFASADTGPKPDLIIKVINAPNEHYYLDLLTPQSGTSSCTG